MRHPDAPSIVHPASPRSLSERPIRILGIARVASFVAAGALAATVVCGAQEEGTRVDSAARLGAVELAATTSSPEARSWFERGVGALHSFWYEEAEEAFRRAREIDPGFYMAYWGGAMTHNHPVWDEVELAAGRAVLLELAPTPEERAVRAPSERERAWMAAVEILFPPETDAAADAGDARKDARDAAYEEAMARLAASYPDVEARVFHDLAIEGVVYGGDDESRRFPLLIRAAADLEELFDEHPDHPGVLHYLIHAYDDPVHAPLGLRAALRYARVAPAAHHALHMPSHIFVQLGRWPEASSSNEDAWASSVEWVERRGLDPDQRDFHSLSWLLYSYLQQGRREKAEEVLALAREAAESGSGHRAMHARTDMDARWRIETGAPAPASLLDGAHTDSRTALAVAIAAYRAGDLAALRRAAGEVGTGDEAGPSARRADDVVTADVRRKEITGLLAVAEGRGDEGASILRAAAALEEEVGPPSGPPATIEPAHELLGEVLLDLDRPAEAREAFEASLRRTPRRARSLLGAARAAAAAGDRESATARYTELLDVWQNADPGLQELEEARTYVLPP